MSTRARRVMALTGVAALHAGVVLFLIAETRAHFLRGGAREAAPMLEILLLELQAKREPVGATGRRSARVHTAERRTEVGSMLPPPATVTTPGSTAIDWTAEAAAAAARQLEGNGGAPRAMGVMPPPSPMFAPAPRRAPGIAWDYAATHRVEPLGGLATAIHVNDNCAVVLFIFIPFAAACTLDTIPARGDLFDHIHDRPGDQP